MPRRWPIGRTRWETWGGSTRRWPIWIRHWRSGPTIRRILYNRGVMLETAHRFEDALVDYRRALSLRPRFPECAHNLGLALAVLGRLEDAWPMLEWRFQARSFPGRHRDFPQPRWIGDPLNGRTLLIHAEQGFGDTIQFSRYAAAIGAGGRVVMEVPRALKRLMTGLPGVDRLVVENDPLPPFDVHCPMLSLPLAFGTGIDTIPPPSVLIGLGTAPVPPVVNGPRIGIAWSGNPAHSNDRRRSMALRAMLPLQTESGLLCSLQTFMHDADRAVLVATPGIVDLGCGFRDFADTAAAIMALDLVISVDTSSRTWRRRWESRRGFCCRSGRSGAGDWIGRTAPGIRPRACSGRARRGIGTA